VNLALVGCGHVGRAFVKLLDQHKRRFPFRITGVQTRRRTEIGGREVARIESIGEFLDRADAEVMVEITPLNPLDGQPAIGHIRAAFARGLHVVTANKGPIAFAYRALRNEAVQAGVMFRFESTVMDGAPVFNLHRELLTGVEVRGFDGCLNSTSKLIIEAMRAGRTFDEGVRQAQDVGLAEADASFDIDGWDSAAKAAALANVLMDAGVTPLDVDRKGIAQLTPGKLAGLKARGKTVVLMSRGKRTPEGVKLKVRAEVLDETDTFATIQGSSNLLLLHTDLMGTLGMLEVQPGIEQVAYGLLADVADIARSI